MSYHRFTAVVTVPVVMALASCSGAPTDVTHSGKPDPSAVATGDAPPISSEKAKQQATGDFRKAAPAPGPAGSAAARRSVDSR